MTRSLENLIDELKPQLENGDFSFNDYLMLKDNYIKLAHRYSENDRDAFAWLYAVADNQPIYYYKKFDGSYEFFGLASTHPYSELTTSRLKDFSVGDSLSETALKQALADKIISKYGFTREGMGPGIASILVDITPKSRKDLSQLGVSSSASGNSSTAFGVANKASGSNSSTITGRSNQRFRF